MTKKNIYICINLVLYLWNNAMPNLGTAFFFKRNWMLSFRSAISDPHATEMTYVIHLYSDLYRLYSFPCWQLARIFGDVIARAIKHALLTNGIRSPSLSVVFKKCCSQHSVVRRDTICPPRPSCFVFFMFFLWLC